MENSFNTAIEVVDSQTATAISNQNLSGVAADEFSKANTDSFSDSSATVKR